MQDQHGNLEVSTQARTDSMQIPTRARCQSTVFPSDQDKCLLLTSPFIEPGTKTDGRGTVTTYCYDALHRLTLKTHSDGSAPTDYTYDLATYTCCGNSIPISYPVGRLIHISNDVNAATTYSYDSMGRVLHQSSCLPSYCNDTGSPVTATYDLAGNLKTLTYPSGRVINYSFDGAGRLYKTYSTSGGEYDYLNVSTFWPTGAWENAVFGNGTSQQDTYNNRLQPNELKLLNSGNAAIADRQYVWTGCAEGMSSANNGNVCGINDLLNSGRNQTYNFDALNRIISGSESDGAFSQTMSYDVWGNPSISGPSGGNARTYNTQNHDTAYGYDAAGNLTNDGTFTYSYDAEEQISSFISNSTGSQVANYVYDADGNRVRKNVGSGWTEYIYFGGNIIAENSPSGWTDYIFGGGKRIAQVSSSGTQYYWGDHLGTTKMTLDASGNSQCYAIYTPFGSEVSGCPTHYKFNAKERDFEDGLDYFGARYYSSNVGHWMTPDWAAKPTAVPYANFGNPQSLNLYSYVQNNPITLGDPDGHDWGESVEFVGGFFRGIASSVSFGIVGAPSSSDSLASLSGQLVGTAAVAQISASTISGSGPTAVAGLVAAPETGGTSLLVSGGALVASAAGTAGAAGAAKNAGAVISAMASKRGGGTSRRPNAEVKKQADASATGADGKQHSAYCGQELTNEPGKPNSKEYDHVDPWAKSKDSSSGNIKGACRTCNRQKGARTPEEWKGQQ